MINYLNDEEIMTILKKYINMAKTEYAILIDGDWGTGKTYFINNVFIKYLEQDNKAFSKVSLYGITKKKEIDNKITESILEKAHPKYGKLLANTFNNIDSISSLINKAIPKSINEIVGTIDVKKLLCKLQDVDNHIIIFDDLERCNLEINVILGYINEYIENKNNKVIIIANQKEISKSKKMNNLELKYLAVKPYNKQIYSQYEKDFAQYASTFGKVKNTQDDSIEKNILDNRVLELFSEDIMYKEIKEKVIGKEIYYLPNIEQISRELSRKLECKLSKTILDNNAKEIARKMNYENHNNVRTLKLVIEKFEEITNKLEEYDIKTDNNYEKILTSILLYLLEAYIKKKKEDEIYNWTGNAEYDLQYEQHKFRFIDDMILTERVDYESVNRCLKEYSKEINSKIETNIDEPVYILKNHYFELEDDEIIKYIDEVYNKLKNKEYNKVDYPKIVYVLLIIKNLGITELEISKCINLMKINLKEINQEHTLQDDLFYSGFNIQNAEIRKEYNQIIKELEETLNTTVSIKIRKNLNDIINGEENWGQNFKSYFLSRNSYRNNIKLFLELNINNLIDVFRISKTKDIVAFRKVIYNMDISKDEVEIVKLLITELEDLVKTEQRKTQKLNFEYLIDNLNEKLKFVSS